MQCVSTYIQPDGGKFSGKWNDFVRLHAEITNYLVAVPQDGQTALILAVKEGYTETMEALLAAKADMNLKEVKKTNIEKSTCTYTGKLCCLLRS